ncbi:LuxR family transcriptional regulator [Paraburkholderia caffeinilytica]|uniref:Helix-turn-helix transcriptional regulator n=1 Tax=Paraburkholderia caffeinilytica TaxID=1761016 RepID=A0ABQ1LYJ8_9BURK|nr:helix-turn-helix transcriptional regulator [Paraburkholderia caffeinilytica]AXL53263.1 LuxR family transcriptional regulator [Paraburkholderia caffeinilytica]GGC31347.1 helix-turn-helix transcriptional regulator [Paraburkholderia caffeinilytica]CAB3796195.1 HTH-type transcriptional regulator MalT [Paraburkholderia caffeinilytica]
MELEWHDLAFHREIGSVIEALDSAQFWTRLTRALERYVVFDNWVALRFAPGVAPLVCAESPTPDGTVDAMFQDYLAALYQLDPFYIAATGKPASGFVTLADVAPDNFSMTDYYQRYFRKNIVGDEVHFNYMIDARHTLAFSLGATQRYGERDLAVLALCAPWVIALLRQRLPYEAFDAPQTASSETAMRTATDTDAPADTPAYAARFEQVSSVSGRSPLTAREVEVAMLTLSGFSTRAIAEKLTISFETVRAHKKHIYTKLNVNSQSELFALFYEAGRKGA